MFLVNTRVSVRPLVAEHSPGDATVMADVFKSHGHATFSVRIASSLARSPAGADRGQTALMVSHAGTLQRPASNKRE